MIYNAEWETYGLVVDGNTSVPLKETQCEGIVCDGIGKFKATQKYINKNQKTLMETEYNFPLNPNAFIDDVTLTNGKRVLESEITEKKSARAQYKEAVENKYKTALLEKTSMGYRIKVGNIEPNEEVIITYTFYIAVPYKDGAYRLSFPSNIAPRYNPGKIEHVKKIEQAQEEEEDETPELKYDNKSETEFYVNITVKCTADFGIEGAPPNIINSIESVTHPTECDIKKITDNEYKIEMHTIGLKKDFNIIYRTNEMCGMQYYEEKEYVYSKIHLKINPVEPDFKPEQYTNILVLDLSGSMDGQKFIQLKEAAILSVNSYQAGTKYNIIMFGTDFEKMYKDDVVLNEQNKRDTIKKINDLQANMGGTELLRPIKYLLAAKIKKNNFINVFIATDGDITNVPEVVEIIKTRDEYIRFFTIGIGKDVNRNLCEQVAKEGGGECKIINDNNSSELRRVLVGQYMTSLLDYCFNVKFTFNSKNTVHTHNGCNHIVPNCSYNIYARTPTSEFNELKDGKGTITMTYTVASTGKIETKTFVLTGSTPNDLIKKLFVGFMIKNGDEGYNPFGIDITKLSLDNRIVSKNTSFIIVDKSCKVDDRLKLKTEEIKHYCEDTSYRGGGHMSLAHSNQDILLMDGSLVVHSAQFRRMSAPLKGGAYRPASAMAYDMADRKRVPPSSGAMKAAAEEEEECYAAEECAEDSDNDESMAGSMFDESHVSAPRGERLDSLRKPVIGAQSVESSSSISSWFNGIKNYLSPPKSDQKIQKSNDISSLQNIDGSFLMDKKVLTALGTTLDKLKAKAKKENKDITVVFHEFIRAHLKKFPEYAGILRNFELYLKSVEVAAASKSSSKQQS
jgi:hypothetical protein